MIENGQHLRQAREALGWSPATLAQALRLTSFEKHGGSRILEMEAGQRRISGPVTVAVESFLRGFLPMGFEPPPVAKTLDVASPARSESAPRGR